MAPKTKKDYVAEMMQLGEVPPEKWGITELKLRVAELREERGLNQKQPQQTDLQQWVLLLNRASRKKADLQKFNHDQLQLAVSENLTIAQLQTQAMERIYPMSKADPTTPVGFGEHSAPLLPGDSGESALLLQVGDQDELRGAELCPPDTAGNLGVDPEGQARSQEDHQCKLRCVIKQHSGLGRGDAANDGQDGRDEGRDRRYLRAPTQEGSEDRRDGRSELMESSNGALKADDSERGLDTNISSPGGQTAQQVGKYLTPEA